MLLCIGPEGTGKTLLLRRLLYLNKPDISMTTVPTVGVNIVTLQVPELPPINIRELGGSMAPIWHNYYTGVRRVMYVIDVSNLTQMATATLLFMDLLANPKLKTAKAGAFSRPILVREWPARHCFISIPRPWVHLVHHGETPTFCLEVLSGKRILLSWAGDVHLPNVDEENSIMVGREVMKGSDIEDGEMGILTQVSVPPSCSAISVTVRTLNQWQDLALNVDSAQSAILSQMRVMTLGQTLPLWLDGGVCIMLTVTGIDPPMNSVVLHPMTQVEVHPPSENEKSEEFTHISFNPSSVNADVKDEDEVTIKDEGSSIETDIKNNMGTSEIYNEIMLRKLVDFMADKLERQKQMKSGIVRRNICRGYRVLPFPSDISSPLCNILQSHPSLVIISKESIAQSAYSDQITFIASVRKIKSPKENQERPSNMKEEGKASETKKKTGKLENQESGSQKLCTVIVWENFARGRIEYSSLLKDMKFIIQKNNCIISSCCRRQMNLEITCLIEMRSTDDVISTMPVSVDVAPVTNVDDSKKEKLLDSLKSLLVSLTNECTVIINPNTILEVEVSGNYIDTCLSTRNKIPLKLTKESVVILETTLLTQAPSLPYIPNSLKDLDSCFLAKYPFLGEDKVMNDLMQHILTFLGHRISPQPIVPQFALVCGSKGSGKTSLMETLVEKLSSSEHFIHCDIISFKQLKGKKMETIEKKLQLVLRESIFRRPSLVILEDLDYLVPLDETAEQESGPVHEHIMQVVSMLRKQLDDLLRFCTTCDSCSVMILGTCVARTSVHPLLVNPQGCHYFPCTFKIPPLEPEGRVAAFLSMLRAHCQQYAAIKRNRKQWTLDKDERSTSSEPAEFHIDTKIIMARTESFVFPDLNHLAFRTFLHARDRWEHCIPNKKGSIIEENECEYNKNALSIYRSSVEMNEDKNDANRQPWNILDSDLEAALDGYTSLALRGIELSEKKAAVGLKVGGLKEAKQILEETLTWPSVFPNLFNKVRLRLRSGVLLYGPPGSGKTLLANAVTAHCQLNFISVKGPELLSKYIGASEQAVRDAFERASSAKPCVLFFDEFESIAPRRGHDSTGVTDRVVNQLLTQMDGVEGLTGVYILAATSRPDLIDPALLRPGRLDKCVYCPMPTTNDRREILEVLSQDIDIGEEIDWSQVANLTENFTGADLQSVLSTAQVLVAQESLGDDLYKGVLPPAEEADNDKNIHIVEECFSFDNEALSNEDNTEVLPLNDMGSQEQVLIEKEKRRVRYSQKSNPSEQIQSEQKNDGPHIYPDSSEEIIANSNHQLSSTTNNFKIYFRHIQAALKEVKPSVTQADQQKYAKLYATFTNSREGNFGQPSPGKRATLA